MTVAPIGYNPNGAINKVSTKINTQQVRGTATQLGTLTTNYSLLQVDSQLNSKSTYQLYKFNLTYNANISLFSGSQLEIPKGIRAQLTDVNGNVIADNYGTPGQIGAFAQLNSSTGLPTDYTKGPFYLRTSYAPGTSTSTPISYDLKLGSGQTYSVDYQTTATTPAVPTPVDPNGTVASSVTADPNATLGTRTSYNTLDESFAKTINIGFLAENKTRLNVVSQLSNLDSADYYSFNFQTGSALKLDFKNQTSSGKQTIRVQLYDPTGNRLYADSNSTDKTLTANYKALTTAQGLSVKNGTQYVVKVSYANPQPAVKTTQTYEFNLYSGTTFTESDKTTASAQTYINAFLAGTLPAQYNTASAAAAYLTNISNGVDVTPFSADQSTATNAGDVFNIISQTA